MIDGIGSGGALSGVAGLGSASGNAQFAAMTGRANAVRGLLNERVARHTEVLPGENAENSGDPMAPVTAVGVRPARHSYGEVNGVRYVRSNEDAAQLYNAARSPEEKKVKETADQFVSILYSMLFKQLDATVQKSGLIDGGQTEKMFQSFVLDEYAKQASSQNSNNHVSHRIYEMLYQATAARRPASPSAAAPANPAAANGPAAFPPASTFSATL